MKTVLLAIAALLLLAVAGLVALTLSDLRADRAERARLRARQPSAPAAFDPAMVADLPEPARRFLTYAILPGTPLRTVAEIEMTGTLDLGTRAAPRPLPMRARQTLAAPHGFLWQLDARMSGLPVTGSDSGRWTRMRLGWLVPVARAGGTPDFERSAFGRYVAEAVFWTPAALLPGAGVAWEAAGPDTARVTVTRGTLSQSVEVALDAEGRPLQVAFDRWTNANPEGVFRLQPFGGTLSDFRQVAGFRLPHRVEAGNMFGTDAYHPFFRAEIGAIRFPEAPR